MSRIQAYHILVPGGVGVLQEAERAARVLQDGQRADPGHYFSIFAVFLDYSLIPGFKFLGLQVFQRTRTRQRLQSTNSSDGGAGGEGPAGALEDRRRSTTENQLPTTVSRSFSVFLRLF